VSRARAFHLLTFLVTAGALALQLVLVAQGHRVLDEHHRPDLLTRLVRFCSYLTIWANALVAWSTLTLALGRDRDTRLWRALRADAVVPVLAVAGWAVFGPRGRLDRSDLLPALVVPVLWLACTLVRGALVSWYPYPVVDVGRHGYAVVLANGVGVAALMLAIAAAMVASERRMAGRGAVGNVPTGA